MKIQNLLIVGLFSLGLMRCSVVEDDPKPGLVISCHYFSFEGKIFSLPSGTCSGVSSVEYDVRENGENFKFKIICTYGCIESVETR